MRQNPSFHKSNLTSYLDLVLVLYINYKFIKSLSPDNIVEPIPVFNTLLPMDRYLYLGTLMQGWDCDGCSRSFGKSKYGFGVVF